MPMQNIKGPFELPPIGLGDMVRAGEYDWYESDPNGRGGVVPADEWWTVTDVSFDNNAIELELDDEAHNLLLYRVVELSEITEVMHW